MRERAGRNGAIQVSTAGSGCVSGPWSDDLLLGHTWAPSDTVPDADVARREAGLVPSARSGADELRLVGADLVDVQAGPPRMAATSPAGKALADEGKVEGRGNTHQAAPGSATALRSALADVEFRKLGVDQVLVGAGRCQSEFPGRDEARAPRVPGV